MDNRTVNYSFKYSLKANFNNLLIQLKSLEFDIIAITETWLHEDQHNLLEMENYTSNFVKEDSQYKVLTNMCTAYNKLISLM